MKVNIKLKTLKEDILYENLPCVSCHSIHGFSENGTTTFLCTEIQKTHFEKIVSKDVNIRQYYDTNEYNITIPNKRISYIKISF